jgi:hypothetical protein
MVETCCHKSYDELMSTIIIMCRQCKIPLIIIIELFMAKYLSYFEEAIENLHF